MIDPGKLCMRCMSELPKPRCFCPHCGFDNTSAENEAHQLECGSILAGAYLVGCALGQGGFGITYVGWDLNLNTKVAIKEYYPEGCVTRDMRTHASVTPLSGARSEFFQRGKAHFVNEAQILAKFAGEPGIVGVRTFFHENGTAYIVMDFVEGETLKSYAARRGGRLPSAEVLRLFQPLCRSLERVHKAGLLHRDISPDNIMLRPDGTLALLDFGAARQMSVAGEHSNTINVKHGFAPEEQYRTHGEQGAWTDVYALCATIYRLTTGVTPPQALDRLTDGTVLTPPNRRGADFTPAQERALLHGLAVRAADRTPSMRRLEAELYGPPDQTAQQTGWPDRARHNGPPDGRRRKIVVWAACIAAAACAAAALLLLVNHAFQGENGAAGSGTQTAARTDEADRAVSAAAATAAPAQTNAPTAAPVLTPTPAPSPAHTPFPAGSIESGIIAAGSDFTLALKSDGSVARIGSDAVDTSGWSDIVQISAHEEHAAGVRANGTVAFAGVNADNDGNVAGWSNIVQVVTGYHNTLGLTADGHVYYTGFDRNHQSDCAKWTGIVKLLGGDDHHAGIKADGTIVAAGYNGAGQCDTSALSGVVDGAVSSGTTYCVFADGSVCALGKDWCGEDQIGGWYDIVAISGGDEHTVGLRRDGTVVAAGSNEYGQCEVSAWTDIIAICTGQFHTVGVCADGTLVATGLNDHGQCNVSGIRLW